MIEAIRSAFHIDGGNVVCWILLGAVVVLGVLYLRTRAELSR